MKFEEMCRTCLRAPESLLSLLENKDLLHKIKIISSVEIQIQSKDELPLWICQECIENVNRSFNFRKVIINSDIELKERCAVFKQLEENSNKEYLFDESNLNEDSSCPDSSISIFEKNNINEASDKFPTVNETKDKNNRNRVRLILNGSNGKLDKEYLSDESNLKEDSSCPDLSGIICEKNNISEVTGKFQTVNDESKDKNNRNRVRLILNGSNGKLYTCTKCNFECTNITEWCTHKKSHISMKVCYICGKSMRADNLNKHIRSHSDELVKCPDCDKVFKNTESMRYHTYSHKDGNYQCDICDRIYTYRSELNRHKKRHTGENSLKAKCEICGKLLSDKKKIKVHMRSHTHERPYLCEFCGKGFITNYTRNVHMRLHTNEKPYKCKYCSQAFPVKVSLLRHVGSKHKDVTESL